MRLALLLLVVAAIAVILAVLVSPGEPGAPEEGGSRATDVLASPGGSSRCSPSAISEPPTHSESPATVEVEGSVRADGEDEDVPVSGARVAVFRRHDPTGGVPWLWEHGDRTIDLRATAEPLAETRTDDEGRFVVNLPASESWLFLAEAAGYVPEMTGWGARNGPVSIRLERARRVTGRIVNPHGAPIAGAEVFGLGGRNEDRGARPARRVGVSDGGGEFAVSMSEADGLLIRAAGFTPVLHDLDEIPGDEPIVLFPATLLRGVVVDDADRPVAGASVLLARDFEWMEIATTDAGGRFTLPGPGANAAAGLELSVLRDGHRAVERRAYPGETNLRIVLPRVAVVHGRIVRPDDRAAPTARLRLLDGNGEKFGPNPVAIDVEGRFRLETLPPGILVLEAVVLGAAGSTAGSCRITTHDARLVLDLAPGDRREDVLIRLTERPVSFIRLRALDPEHRPLKGINLLSRALPSGATGHVVTAANGVGLAAFALPPGTPVRITLGPPHALQHLRGASLVLPTVTNPDGEAHTVVLEAGVPLAILARTPDGQPLAKGTVATVTINGSATRRTAPDRFVAPLSARPGAHLFARVPGLGVLARTITEEEITAGVLEARLLAEPVLRGRLRPPEAWAGPDSSLHLRRPFLGWTHPARIDAESGRIEIRGVPPGPIEVWFSPGQGPDELLACLDLSPGEDHDLGDIRRGSRIEGHVFGEDGAPLPGAAIRLQTRRARASRSQTETDARGGFSFHRPSGVDAFLDVRCEGWMRAYHDLEDEPTDGPIEIRLRPEGPVRVRLEPPPPFRASIGFEVETARGWIWWHEKERVLAEGASECTVHVLHGLPVDATRIRARSADATGRWVVGEAPVRVVSGAVREVVIRFRSLR